MWLLDHAETHEKFRIVCDKVSYTVGRTIGELQLPNDQSISRKHASFFPIANGRLFIMDEKSKYGVYVNADAIETNKAIAPGQRIEVRSGDIIRFGRFQNIWRVEHVEIIITTSLVTVESKANIDGMLKILDGRLFPHWNDACTHLVMDSITTTMKLLMALVNCVPVVTPQFFEQTLAAIQAKQPVLPKESAFIPSIEEEYILQEKSMYECNPNRLQLFEGKTFVFLNVAHQQQYQAVINAARGKCLNLVNDKMKRTFLLEKNVIPINYDPSAESQSSQNIATITEFLRSNNRRVVQDSEIGLAIVHASMTQFCNPDHRYEDNFRPIETSPGVVLLPETPQADSPPQRGNTEIMETMDVNDEGGDEEVQVQDAIPTTPTTRSTRQSTRLTGAVASATVEEVAIATPAESNKRKADATPSPGTSKRTRVTMDLPQADEKSPVSSRRSNRLSNPKVPESKVPDVAVSKAKPSPSKTFMTRGQPKVNPVSVAIVQPSSMSPPPISAPHKIVSQSSASQSMSLSGFLTTQNRTINTSKAMVSTENTSKRPHDNSDDDDENGDDLFAFKVKPMNKKAKNARENSSENLFGFSNLNISTRLTQRNTSARPIDEPAAGASVSFADRQKAIMQAKIAQCKPLPDAGGWLSKRTVKQEIKDDDDSAGVKVKDEPLEEHEMTTYEINRRWERSLVNKIEVRTMDSSYIKKSAYDCVDGVRNFKKFVKVIYNQKS